MLDRWLVDRVVQSVVFHRIPDKSVPLDDPRAIERWLGLSAEDRGLILGGLVMHCECGERSGRRWKGSKWCPFCHGKGKRALMAREVECLDWQETQWREQYSREHRDEACSVPYVMANVNRMAERGCWKPPKVTDGFVIQRYVTQERPVQVEVTAPVKQVNAKGEVVGTEVKAVMVSAPDDAIQARWVLLRQVLGERAAELRAAIQSDEQERALWLIRKIQTIMRAKGHARSFKDEIRGILGERFGEVRHLWRKV